MTHYLKKIFYTIALLLSGLCVYASGCYDAEYIKYDLVTREGELYIQAALTSYFIFYSEQTSYKLEGIVPNNLSIINRTTDMILFSVDDGYYMFYIEGSQCTYQEQIQAYSSERSRRVKITAHCFPPIKQIARVAKGKFTIVKLYEKNEVSEIAHNWFFKVRGKWYFPRLPTDPEEHVSVMLPSQFEVLYSFPYYGKLLIKERDTVYFFSVEKGLKEIWKTTGLEVIFREDEVLIVKDTAHVYFYSHKEEKMCILPKLDPTKTRIEYNYVVDDSTSYNLGVYGNNCNAGYNGFTSKFVEMAEKDNFLDSDRIAYWKSKLSDSATYMSSANEYINAGYQYINGSIVNVDKFARYEYGEFWGKLYLDRDGESFSLVYGDQMNRIKLNTPPKSLGTAVAYDDRLLIGGKDMKNPSTIDKLVFLGATVDARERCDEPPAPKFYSFFKDDQHVYYHCSGSTQLSIMQGLRPIDYQVDDYDQLFLLMRQLMCPLRPMQELKKTKWYMRIQVAFSKHLNTNSRDFSELKKRFLQVDYIKEKNGYRYIIETNCLIKKWYSDSSIDLFLAEIQKIIPDAKIVWNRKKDM